MESESLDIKTFVASNGNQLTYKSALEETQLDKLKAALEDISILSKEENIELMQKRVDLLDKDKLSTIQQACKDSCVVFVSNQSILQNISYLFTIKQLYGGNNVFMVNISTQNPKKSKSSEILTDYIRQLLVQIKEFKIDPSVKNCSIMIVDGMSTQSPKFQTSENICSVHIKNRGIIEQENDKCLTTVEDISLHNYDLCKQLNGDFAPLDKTLLMHLKPIDFGRFIGIVEDAVCRQIHQCSSNAKVVCFATPCFLLTPSHRNPSKVCELGLRVQSGIKLSSESLKTIQLPEITHHYIQTFNKNKTVYLTDNMHLFPKNIEDVIDSVYNYIVNHNTLTPLKVAELSTISMNDDLPYHSIFAIQSTSLHQNGWVAKEDLENPKTVSLVKAMFGIDYAKQKVEILENGRFV